MYSAEKYSHFKHYVEMGSDTSTVTLRAVRGEEKGTQSLGV
jgi:hypothetical protein